MKNKHFIIGSRASKLALVQAHYVREALHTAYPSFDFEIKTIKTVGDKILDVALSKIGDKGLFTKEIEEALLQGEIDLAVHSMKDLPTELPKSLKIAAVTAREDPADVLVSKQGFTLHTLPKGSRVGTSSLRRRAQLSHLRSDLNTVDLRGNLDTRIKKLEQGLYDGIILAHAGIVRLGFALKLSVIPMEEILPQAGQGALGIEIRADKQEVAALVNVLDNGDAHCAVDGERALLAGLEGGCQVPIGVYAQVQNNKISIKAGVFSLDGKIAVRDELTGNKTEAGDLGRELAERMIKNRDVQQILEEVRKNNG
jgi:hydroxymethylbilane synthase